MGYLASVNSKQRGVILLVLLLVLMLGLSSLLLSRLNRTDSGRRERSAAALLQARQALLAWSLSRDGTVGTGNCSPASSSNGRACSPLELPCPANPNETLANSIGTSITSCNSAGAARLGWLPWKTLGIPKLVDAYGEPLWYAVDRGFVVRTSDTEARKINSDSFALLSLRHQSGELPATDISTAGQAPAALIFAAGAPLAGQSRSSPLQADQFLEGGNAMSGGPYLSRNPSDSYNDQITSIKAHELIDRASPRLAAQIARQLQNYYQTTRAATPIVSAGNACGNAWQAGVAYAKDEVIAYGGFHWRARVDHPAAPRLGNIDWQQLFACDEGLLRPYPMPYPADIQNDSDCQSNTLTVGRCPARQDLCAGILPRADASWTGISLMSPRASNLLPVWFAQNVWHRAVFYAVRQGRVCTRDFEIDGVPEPAVDALFIVPGSSRSQRANNLLAAAAASTDLRRYLDDAANQGAWLNDQQAQFVTPGCDSNDLLYLCRDGVCSPRKKPCP
ncbi:hypothetical protein [Chitinibacter sp. S2-10]|uniref:hypothetical protein n=1 Tax=Chitinibacter sp. S2-10 TaxID=3373597 RepID=UPI003977E299